MAQDIFAIVTRAPGLNKLDTHERNIHAKGADTPETEQAS
jgi:hypothetical protein